MVNKINALTMSFGVLVLLILFTVVTITDNVRLPLRRIWSYSIGGYRNTPRPVVSQSGEVIFHTSSQADPDTPWVKQTINAIDVRNGEFAGSYGTGGSFELHDHVAYAEGLVFASDFK